MSSSRVVALLPMKANSERVPGKNFRDFCGKPLYRWILDTLLQVQEIDKIVINTDAKDILADKGLVECERILIRDRKPEICGDDVSMNSVLADDIANISSDIYLMTHTTNPLLSAETIISSLNLFKNKHTAGLADSLFTVNKVQTRFYRQNGSAVNHDPVNLIPTQYLEPWFEENSNLYIFTAESFMKTGARIGIQPMMYETPALESADIDTAEDWEFAVAVARFMEEKGINA